MNLFEAVYDDQPPAGQKPGDQPPAGQKMLPQEEVNKIVEQRLAEERKKFAKKEGDLLQRMEQLDLSAKQKEQLEAQLEELRTSTMTKEQLSQEASEKQKKAYEKELKKASEDRDHWRNTYVQEKINVDLFSAASDKGEDGKEEAFNPSQIVELLRGRTRIAEEISDDGKPTGRLVTKVKIDTVDKDGKPVTLDLMPKDAVKAMRGDKSRYGNLFKSGATGGLGGHTNSKPDGKSDSIKDMPMDELYKKYRENPASLGLRR